MKIDILQYQQQQQQKTHRKQRKFNTKKIENPFL